MKTLRLKTVDAYVAFDFECPTSAGGTRLAPDVTEHETQLLARAMTYTFAVLGVNFGGGKGTIRATPEERDDAVARYVDEIRPLVESAKFLTATDLGTMPDDIRSLPGTDQADLMHTDYMGMPLDRSEEHTSELQSRSDLVCRLLLEKKKKKTKKIILKKKNKQIKTKQKTKKKKK